VVQAVFTEDCVAAKAGGGTATRDFMTHDIIPTSIINHVPVFFPYHHDYHIPIHMIIRTSDLQKLLLSSISYTFTPGDDDGHFI